MLRDIIRKPFKVFQLFLSPKPILTIIQKWPTLALASAGEVSAFSQMSNSFWTSIFHPPLKQTPKSGFRGGGFLSLYELLRWTWWPCNQAITMSGTKLRQMPQTELSFSLSLVVTLNSCHHLWGKTEIPQGNFARISCSTCGDVWKYVWENIKWSKHYLRILLSVG